VNAIHNWLNNFIPVEDSDQQLKQHILSFIFVRVCLFTLLVTVPSIFHIQAHNLILPNLHISIAFLVVVVFFSVCSVLIVRRTALSLKRFGVIQLLADIGFTALLVYASGCSHSIFTPLFILPIIVGGLILYKLGGLIPAAAATISYAIVLGVEYVGAVPRYFQNTAYEPPLDPFTVLNLFAVYGITFFVIAIISGQLAGRLRRTEKELSKTVLEFDRLSLLYKQIFDDITTGIITTDEKNIITSYNNAAERITGCPTKRVMGIDLHTCFPEIQLTGDKERNVCHMERSDGTVIRVGYSFSQLGVPAASENDDGHSYCKVVTLQDISKIELMEKQMREAEKMAAIGELSASIAHDFRNPLAAISGSAQILAMDYDEDDIAKTGTGKTLVGIILRESKRMATTITDFLQFARPEAAAQKWFDLDRLITEVTEKTMPLYEQFELGNVVKDIEIHLNCWGDQQQIQTILTHLIDNTRSISDAEQAVKVAIRAFETNRKNINYTCIEVCDTGPGIPTMLQKKVFTPFFSTREDGTGLGLAIVKQLIDNHNGIIEIDSDNDYGCIIRLFLPHPEVITH
jgi:two-component system sensor histidine kinase PilS (NtrC family)